MKLNFVLRAALVMTFSLGIFSCDILSSKRERMRIGEEVIAKVEAFKKEKGRLPESAAEIGVTESEGGPVFYQKKSPARYIVSFSIGFDETYSYDSETGKWQSGAIL